MIQSILFFVLGFLCAGFLALMVAPVIWRRAVVLTRKRIEASAPLSADEIQADKDRLRAEFAMSTRRLEMGIKALKEKASVQLLEISRKREELRLLAEQLAQKDEQLKRLEASAEEMRSEMREREEHSRQLTAKLIEAENMLEERALDLEKLGRMYDEASFLSSSRQIELVARETEVEKLADDVVELRELRKDADRRVREITSLNKALQDELKLEKRRAGEVEKRLERTLASLSDREDKLHRQEQELERLRAQQTRDAGRERELSSMLAQVQEQKVRLEAEMARLTQQISTMRSSATGDVEKAMAKIETARNRLEERLTTLTRENKKLRDRITSLEGSKPEGEEERRENALLREQINDLAAEVVNLTLMLEGPDSPIHKALAQPANGQGDGPGRASLADKVRALRKAVPAPADATRPISVSVKEPVQRDR